jgi:hypothetical protein
MGLVAPEGVMLCEKGLGDTFITALEVELEETLGEVAVSDETPLGGTAVEDLL